MTNTVQVVNNGLKVNEFEISKYRLSNLEAKIRRLNRLCQRLELPELEMKRSDFYIKDIAVIDQYTNKQTHKISVKACKVGISGNIPKINGWEFVALIEHGRERNIVKSLSSTATPEQYFTLKGSCEHCNTNRVRKYTVLIQNTETKEFKQIGKSCLNDYLGHSALELFKLQDSIFYMDEIETWENFPADRHYIYVSELLKHAYNHIVERKNGFRSKSKAIEEGGTSTADRIIDERIIRPFRTYSKQCEEEVEKIIKYVEGLKLGCNDYINNIIGLVLNRTTTEKNIGFVVSIVSFYQREMRKIEEENEVIECGTFGIVKEKFKDLEVTYKDYFITHGVYGVLYLHKFLTMDNKLLVWSTAKSNEELNIKKGQQYEISGTVKNHNTFRGQAQTYITRCKVK